jgi:hypothetical protein
VNEYCASDPDSASGDKSEFLTLLSASENLLGVNR